MPQRFTTLAATIIFGVGLAMLAATPVIGYDSYRPAGTGVGCVECHPGFTGMGPLHQMHVGPTRMTENCLLCHVTVGDSTSTFESGDPAGQGCRGCHGRDNGTLNKWGAGLRAHHANAGAPVDSWGLACSVCHSSDPAPLHGATVPVYYSRADVNIDDPCKILTPGGEDWDMDGQGLDNDGDLIYDASDPDCALSGVEDLAATRLLLAIPSPVSSGAASIRFRVPALADVGIEVFDLKGRRIREERRDGASAGWHVLRDAGRDAAGRLLPSGVYVVRLQAAGAAVTGRMVFVK